MALLHNQTCCEEVYLENVCGDIDDLIGTPLTLAEETWNRGVLEGVKAPKDADTSQTWTFYRLATTKGYVTLRWFGSSNGCYIEDVSCYWI